MDSLFMVVDSLKFINDLNKIKIYDKFLQKETCDHILNSIEECPFYRTETDEPGLPKTGLIYNLGHDHQLYKVLLKKIIQKKILDIKNYKCDRFYVNLFLKNENPFFHIDSESGKDITFLYYPSNSDNINYSGNTDFILNEKIISIPYVQNRLIHFPANFTHRATSFYNKDRFSLALKMTHEG